MTFDRDVYDTNPEIGFMTYRHPTFESLLAAALNPGSAVEVKAPAGRLDR